MLSYLIRRIAAYWIDCTLAFSVVMLVFQWAILSHFRDSIGITEEWFKNSINMQLYVWLTISIPVWLYFTYFDSKKTKGTFGKRLFKIQVRSISGHRISFGKSFLRTILKLLPWEIAHFGVIFPEPIYYAENPNVGLMTYFGLLLFGIYVLSIFLSKNTQTLYDKVLKSEVKPF